MDAEEWRSVVGFEGVYEVSSLGRVRRMWRHGPKMLNPGRITGGYVEVTLMYQGIKRRFGLGRLVAETFVPRAVDASEVNHIDGNKQNNSAGNLEWVTHAENVKHAYDKLGALRGTSCDAGDVPDGYALCGVIGAEVGRTKQYVHQLATGGAYDVPQVVVGGRRFVSRSHIVEILNNPRRPGRKAKGSAE